MTKIRSISFIILIAVIASITCSCSDINKSISPKIRINGNDNIIEGIEYSIEIENVRNKKEYIITGHGLLIFKISNFIFKVIGQEDTTHYLEVYEVFKSDTNRVLKKVFNVIPMPHPKIRWGIYNNSAGTIETTKSELLAQKHIFIDKTWKKSKNLVYKIIAVELQSDNTAKIYSTTSRNIPEAVLKGISKFEGKNKIVMTVKVKCPDGKDRIYATYHYIRIID